MKPSICKKYYGLGFLLLSVFLFSWQAGANEEGASAAELGNTYWKLTELEGQPVVTAANQREMKITLRGENKVTGFAGCNSFFGTYQHDEEKLSFSQLAATRMFCADTMDLEAQFMKSLTAAKTYRISGQILQLYGIEGKLIARFEAVYLDTPPAKASSVELTE